MGPKLEEMIYQHLHYQASNWLIGVVFVVSVALVVFIFRLRFIKNVHLKVFVVWIVLMLAALAMWCLRLPFVRWA
jgi:ABC-type transport system involved in cytochrome bd biosynthesis fused ATPase/permease subunit